MLAMSLFQTAHGGALHLTKRLVAHRAGHCINAQAPHVRNLCASQHWTDEHPATLLQEARIAFSNACAEPRPISQSARTSTPPSLARAATAAGWAALAWSAVGLAAAAPWRLLLASSRPPPPPPPLDLLDDGARARRAARARRRAEEALDRADGVRSKRRPMLKKKREDPEGGPWSWPDRRAPGPKKRKQQHPPRERGGGGDSGGPREPRPSGRKEASRGGGGGKDGAPWEGSGPRRERLTPAKGRTVDKSARVDSERSEAVGKNDGDPDGALKYSKRDGKQAQERKPRDITKQKTASRKSGERPEGGGEIGP